MRGAGLLGAGAAVASLPNVLGAPAAEATPGHHRPDSEDTRFTLAVLPDTQYLFDADRGDPAPLDASLRYVLENDDNVVFLAHLGDLTENGQPGEFAQISRSFQALDRRRFPYSTLAGNHDINSSTDDQRGRTAYLDAFGPQRQRAPRRRSAERRRTATTATTSSRAAAVNGCSSRSTGGRRRVAWPGRSRCSRSTRTPRRS